MVKLIQKITILSVTAVSSMLFLANPVSAQSATNCPNPVIIYGVTYCPSKTPFTIGSVVIDDLTMAVMLVMFVAVFAVIVNALVVKGRLARVTR